MIIHKRHRQKVFVKGRGLVINNHKGYYYGKGFGDQIIPLITPLWNFASNPESAKNVGKIVSDVVDIGKKVKDVVDSAKELKRINNARKAAKEIKSKVGSVSPASAHLVLRGSGFMRV